MGLRHPVGFSVAEGFSFESIEEEEHWQWQ